MNESMHPLRLVPMVTSTGMSINNYTKMEVEKRDKRLEQAVRSRQRQASRLELDERARRGINYQGY